MSVTGIDGTTPPPSGQSDLPLIAGNSDMPQTPPLANKDSYVPLSIKEDWQTLTAQRDYLAQNDIQLDLRYLRRLNPARRISLLLHGVEFGMYTHIFSILDAGRERLGVDDLTTTFLDHAKSPSNPTSVLRVAAKDDQLATLLRYDDWHDRLDELRSLPKVFNGEDDLKGRISHRVMHIEAQAAKTYRRGLIGSEHQ
jgi:hypothetical protein